MNNQLIIAKKDEEFSIGHKMMVALQDTTISKAPVETLGIAVSAAIERASFYLGLNKTQSDKDNMKLIVMEDCQRSFRSLTISEIKLAIEMGSRGEYGEVRGMAPKDVFTWIMTYMRGEYRRKLLKSLEQPDTSWQPTEKELIEARHSSVDRAWQTFKDTGFFKDRGNHVYSILDRNQILRLSVDEKNVLLSKAKDNLLLEFDITKIISNPFKLKEIRDIRYELLADNYHIRIKNEAKQIALTDFFKRLVDEGIELSSLIKCELQ